MLHGEPLYALTDAGRKAYYAARAHSQATRRGQRKPQPEPQKAPPPTAPEGSPLDGLTREMVKAMGGSSGRDDAKDMSSAEHRGRKEVGRPPKTKMRQDGAGDRALTEAEARRLLEQLPSAFKMVPVDGGYRIKHRTSLPA